MKYIGEHERWRAVHQRFSLAATLVVVAILALAACNSGSDEFDSSSLGSQWTFVDPVGDSAVSVTGSHAEISVPGGTSHDLWTNSLNAPRLLQTTTDGDLQVEAKIDSPVALRYQLQGLIVQQDANNLVRADILHDGSNLRLFTATVANGVAVVRGNVNVSFTAPYWLRLNRVGDTWTFEASDDGGSWINVATFTHALAPTGAGIFAGNHDPAPAHTASFDYFRVGAGNNPPVANADAVSTPAGTAVTINVVGNDTDFGGTIDPATVAIISNPANGTATTNPATGAITYTPNAGHQGPDTLAYRVQDNDGQTSNSATVTITTTAPLPPPTQLRFNTGAVDFVASPIDIALDQGHDVASADLDGDGDIDLVASDFIDDAVRWYENLGSSSYAQRTVGTNLDGAYPVGVGDVDGDGDIDVLATGYYADTVVWYENDGAANFIRRTVDAANDGPHSVVAVDLDADGDQDLLTTSQQENRVDWYENNGSQGFTRRSIDTSATAAKRAEPVDLDQDGDIDIVAASDEANEVAWYENNGSESFTKHVVASNAGGAYYAEAGDLDGDGDIDIVAALRVGNSVVWYENSGSEGFTSRTINTSVSTGARTVRIGDVDGDGDLDVMAASADADSLAWYDNDGNGAFTLNVIANIDGVYGLEPADVDGDGDLDVISVGRDDNTLRLHQQTRLHTATIVANSSLAVGPAQLEADDPSAPPQNLVYTVISAPTSGALQVSGTTLSTGGTFTQDDINASLVQYVHSGTANDSFSFSLSNGTNPPLDGTFVITTVN